MRTKFLYTILFSLALSQQAHSATGDLPDEARAASPQLGAVRETMEQRRSMIAQQDAAYQASLAADEKKERLKAERAQHAAEPSTAEPLVSREERRRIIAEAADRRRKQSDGAALADPTSELIKVKGSRKLDETKPLLLQLPQELLLKVLSFLSTEDLAQWRLTSSGWGAYLKETQFSKIKSIPFYPSHTSLVFIDLTHERTFQKILAFNLQEKLIVSCKNAQENIQELVKCLELGLPKMYMLDLRDPSRVFRTWFI